MKFGVPWSVKGIRPEARETAREAARRAGMSLGDWLNSVILHQAEQDGIEPEAAIDDDEDAYGGDVSSLHHRLDEISRRIDKVARGGPSAYAPKHARNDPEHLAALIQRLDRRLDQFANVTRPGQPPLPPAPQLAPAAVPPVLPPALDLAVAEIAARQRALNGQPPLPHQAAAAFAPPAVAAAPRAPVPAQDLSGLEEQLRTITNQIETLHRPGVEEAINALRDELGEIAHTITEAMPRRAIDTIERQIAGLTQRIAEGRQAGVDGNALASIEHGLAEVRDTLTHLTPAESLVGFNEAVADLAHKIDMIVAQQDPATMQQLEYAVNTLRDIGAHVASNETVSQLAAEVQRLAQNVEHIAMASGGGDALANLEQRINALSDALAERAQNGGAVPPRLEALVNSLSDKIEQVQLSRGDTVAAGHLEDRIAELVQKLDASDTRLGHLEAIERGLADLLVHIEDIKAGQGGGAAPEVDSLKYELARTQDALDAVHGTLGHVVDRLAVIEQGMSGARTETPPMDEPLDLRQPVGKLAVRLIDAAAATPLSAPPHSEPPPEPLLPEQPLAPPLAPQPEAADVEPQPMPPPPPPAAFTAPPVPPPAAFAPAAAEPSPPPKRMPAAHQLPIDPDLPPDQPLEPGSGPPRFRTNPAARIAASEAALGGARPAAATVPSNKSNFIAAARRAAQAAVKEQAPRTPRSAADFTLEEEAPRPSLRERLGKRVKTLFVASSVIAVVVGGAQIASNFIDFGGTVAERAPADAKKLAEVPAKPDAPATVAANSATQPAAAPLAAPATETAANNPAANAAPPTTTAAIPPAGTPDAQLPGFVTGSISHPAFNEVGVPSMPLVMPPVHDGDRLPDAIGGIRLRSAAAAGDAAAAYEVGVRYAEGRGVPADVTEAARWFERAASKGLAPAQFRYGSLLEKGQGVKKDLTAARRYYLAAASAGNAKAMHNLAVLYAEGIDGKPDYALAVQWFRKAADRGIPDSQFNLGVLYARGLGVPVSMAESYKWFALAASRGDKESVKKRDEIASHLDARTLAAAEHAVKTFVAAAQPEAAINVPAPSGGWDATAAAPQHAPAVNPAKPAKPHIAGPLVLGRR